MKRDRSHEARIKALENLTERLIDTTNELIVSDHERQYLNKIKSGEYLVVQSSEDTIPKVWARVKNRWQFWK